MTHELRKKLILQMLDFGYTDFWAIISGGIAGGMLMLNLTGLGLWWFWRHREEAAAPAPVLP